MIAAERFMVHLVAEIVKEILFAIGDGGKGFCGKLMSGWHGESLAAIIPSAAWDPAGV
jgi:hypothetical protein